MFSVALRVSPRTHEKNMQTDILGFCLRRNLIAKKWKELLDRWCIPFLFREMFWHKDTNRWGYYRAILLLLNSANLSRSVTC